MRVLGIIPHLGVGGVQRQMLLAFRGLRERGFACEVCCLDYEGLHAARFRDEGFPVHLLSFGRASIPSDWSLFGLCRRIAG